MRILFYLPVVTPWWFANIIVPLVRACAQTHELHVMAPPTWRGTGIGRGDAAHIETLPHVHWHLLDGPDHPRLRVDASGESDLIDFVDKLAPDLTLCRSADTVTPALFPGEVRYIMEGGAPPFCMPAEGVTLKHTLFDHGFLPPMNPETARALDAIGERIWSSKIAHLKALVLPSREEFLTMAGIEDGSHPLIGLPLEYEHPECFFTQHHAFPNNADMIRAVAEAIGDRATLLVTHHPLSELHGDVSEANAVIAGSNGKVRLLRPDAFASSQANIATQAMAAHCDAMIVGNSKSWTICAALETAVLRLSSARSADWVSPYSNLTSLLSDVANGRALPPDQTSAKRWLAHHICNCVFDPLDPALSADDITRRAAMPVDPTRWDAALARYHALNPDPLKPTQVTEETSPAPSYA